MRLGSCGVVLVAVALANPSVLRGQKDAQAPALGASLSVAAVSVAQPPKIDGVMDEAFWESIPAITEFRQRVPVDGAAPSERTEVRIAYDQKAIYFGLKMYDSEPRLIRSSILVREGRISQDDHVWIGLDTYHDRRNGYLFELNPFGTQGDALITDESSMSWDWVGVYESQARITDEGWVLEVAIPFMTIRFSAEDAPEMGIAIRRSIRRKNEEVFWPHIPARFRGGFRQVSQYATLTRLRDLPQGRYMELKPFVIAGAQKPGGDDETHVLDDVGIDVKYAVTSNLTADLTWNTDFAQVEADNVQVNLTRFSLFFPEKREFFLERAGLFSFGDNRETEIFFSRRIGLSNEIIGGGRVTGQMGRLSVGMLSLQTDDTGSGEELVRGANNSVLRIRGDVLPRTTVGGIFTNLQNGDAHNRVVGADAQVRFWGGSAFSGWYAAVSDSQDGTSAAGSLKLDIRPQRSWVAGVEFKSVEPDFDPGLGFVRRRDVVQYGGT